MNSNFPPPKPAAKKTDSEPKDSNALWRIQDWFKELPAPTLALLKAYHTELLKFNLKLNLISRNTERDADEAHFADCMLAAQILLAAKMRSRVFDIGSGNGLPGIILAIMDPSREYVLVESDARKSEFLKHAIAVLQLKNAVVMNVRFENLGGQGMDCAVSRGFASISKTVLACNKIFPKGGQFFHLKGNSWSSEVAELPSQLISVWAPQLLGEYTLPVSQARRAIVITQKTI